MTAYDDLKKALGSYYQASQVYDKVSHFSEARQTASQFARDEGDETIAQTILDPRTPIETAIQGVGIGLGTAKSKLEDIVEKRFDDILKDENVKSERLEASLLSFNPKKGIDKKYEKFADAHKVYRNIVLYEHRDRENAQNIGEAISTMSKDIVSHYEEKYKEKSSDSEEVKKQKNIIKNFFLAFYFDREGKPAEDGRILVIKYAEINNDKIKKFSEEIKNRGYITDYIKEALPEDKETRIRFLSSLIS